MPQICSVVLVSDVCGGAGVLFVAGGFCLVELLDKLIWWLPICCEGDCGVPVRSGGSSSAGAGVLVGYA